MNKHHVTVFFGSTAALIFSACIVSGPSSGGTTSGDTAGGTGGESSGGVGGGTTAGNGGVGGGTTTSSGTTCDMNYKCGEAITPPDGNPSKLCDGTEAAMLYDAYFECVCKASCMTECGDNACADKPATDACNTCRQDKCKMQFDACANNL